MARRLSTVMQGSWLVLKRTAGKFFDDNGLFLASGLAFDLLLFCFPFSLLFVSALGFALGSSDRAIEALQAILQELLPITRPAFMENLVMVLENKGLLGLLGGALFFLTSSLMFGSVRGVFDTVFRVRETSHFFRGKAVDVLVMLLASGLLALMIGLTSLLTLADDLLERFPRLDAIIGPGWVFAGDILGFLFTLALFYLLYRFCPSQTLRRPALFVAAFTGATLFEISKWVFAWYVGMAEGTAAWFGAVGSLFFFLMWVYYACAVLIVGAEAGWSLQQENHPSGEQ
ncbi:MAG: YihY/virulence factor BrkB family protein [Nitrospirales bacterium]|nr:YihY/virulence factor BrkB family protein [Nitrospirales bacterium]